MTISIELPPPLDQELEAEAAREGVTASEQATLLLLLATVLTGEGRKTSFRSVARQFLERNAIDVGHLADVCEGLMALCLRQVAGSTSMPNDPSTIGPTDDNQTEVARAFLQGWRSPDVHREIGVDFDVETMRMEFPPLEQLVQRVGRMKRSSAMGKYAGLGGGTEEFMKEKQLEIDREDRR